MNCEQGDRWLARYLDGTLGAGDRESFEDHLRGCPECRESVEVWNRLAALPEAAPTPRLRRAFELDLARETAPRHWMLPVPRFAAWAAAACLLLAIGWAAGRFTGTPKTEVTELRTEVRQLRSLVAVSLLHQQSASERLRGIGYAGHIREESRDVLDALISALKYDPNVNVRLAACDALRRHASDTRVRRAFVDALGVEDSPLGKVALIDALVELRETQSAGEIARLAVVPDEDAAVKERAMRALEQLKAKGSLWKE